MKNIKRSLLCVIVLLLLCCAQDPDSQTVRRYALALEAYAQGNHAHTIEILQQEKRFPPALLLRAKAEYFSGDLIKAEKTLQRLIKIRPSAYEGKIYLARIYRDKGETAKAVNLTETLLADNPQDIRTLRLAADLAIENEKLPEAASFLDRAAESSAESALVLLDRARLRWVSGREADALEDLTRAKAMLPWETPLLRAIVNLENTIKGNLK